MEKRVINIGVVALICSMLTGCELAGDILEFGFWLGIIVVAVIVAIIFWIIRKFRR